MRLFKWLKENLDWIMVFGFILLGVILAALSVYIGEVLGG